MAAEPNGRNPVGSDRSYRGIWIFISLLIPVSVLAFWKTYFGILGSPPESTDLLIHVHTVLMFGWVLMLIAQAWLAGTGRFDAHRWVGRSSYVIAPLIILTGLATIQHEFRRTLDGARVNVMAFGMVAAYAITWSLAILYRRRPSLHVRFMISTLFAIATAIVFRLLVHWVPGFGTNGAAMAGNGIILVAGLVLLIVADRKKGMQRSPYWVVTVVIVVGHLGYWTFAATQGWLQFCRWFASLAPPGA